MGRSEGEVAKMKAFLEQKSRSGGAGAGVMQMAECSLEEEGGGAIP